MKRFTLLLFFATLLSCSSIRGPRDIYYALAPLKKPQAPAYYLEDVYDGLFTGYDKVQGEFATAYIDSMYAVVKEQYRKELLELGLPEDAYQRGEVMKWALYFARHANVKINARLRRGAPYLSYIKRRLREEGMPEAIAYLPIIESAFRHNALSRMRARGIWQFMRSTARKYGLRVDWWMDERLDPYRSTDAAVAYLKDLYNMFGSWDLALAAYNAGEGRVLRALRRSGGDDFFDLKMYLRRETREYVPKFLALVLVINNPEKFNTNIIMPDMKGQSFDTVYVPRQVNISLLSKWAQISEREFRKLNPSFIRWATPPYLRNFPVRIPHGRKNVFYARMKSTPKSKWYRALAHRVRRGESLWLIARKYGVSVYALKRANRIRNSHYLRPGQVLIIPVGPGSRMRYAKRTRTKVRKTGKGYHRVREGETLWSIARAYGVSVKDIKRVNGLRSSRIRPGDILKMPTKKYASSKMSIKHPVKTGKGYHMVKSGETLWTIARKYGVSVSTIKKLNHLRGSRIKPGDVLKVPNAHRKKAYVRRNTSLPRSGRYYTVKRGDTLWKIARKIGVSVEEIKEANGLAGTSIKPGQVLRIPLNQG